MSRSSFVNLSSWGELTPRPRETPVTRYEAIFVGGVGAQDEIGVCLLR